MDTVHTIKLDIDEEQIARALTRDAWGYFSSLISNRDLFHVKDIPRIPRGGRFEIAGDPELVHYYLNFSKSYESELCDTGWTPERFQTAYEGFCQKLESATGIKRGEHLPAASEGNS
jgi:hypothetical protein